LVWPLPAWLSRWPARHTPGERSIKIGGQLRRADARRWGQRANNHAAAVGQFGQPSPHQVP
jgi:hypothetical protein